jgi:transcriptional regulator with GAF, ATPase, and Fis domain
MLPPLRDRREDIVPLIWHFVDNFSRRLGKTITDVPQETLARFEAYNWPGNVRELQNLIERAIILSDNGVLPNPLPVLSPEVIDVGSSARTLKDSERALISQTLQDAGWVIGGATGAAARLGLKRTTLIAKMKKLGISRPGPGSDMDQVHNASRAGNVGSAVQ